ncbi:LmeA family phospholipid-binding protein [Kitasatospora cineracea]|uniref:LmeA family phospholipid-binding protein n=1 Tax=Kitasatospora cineracea TaxID=88074 RepID=UPI003688452E
MHQPVNGRAPRSRRRRYGWIAAALALLAAAGGEALATQYTQERIADSARRNLNLATAPEVRVHGFPVSLQVARGVVTEADIDAAHVPADLDGRVLTVQDVAVHLRGVHRERDGGGRADEAEVTATVAYDDLSAFYGVAISRGEGDDRVAATARLPLLGQVTGSARIGVAAPDAVGLDDVRLPENVPPAARTLLERALERRTPLDQLPEGLALRSVAVTDHGIVARMSGHGVELRPRTA